MNWFEKGLRFKCTGCGKCCTGAPGFVWVNQEEMEAISKFTEQSLADFKKSSVRQIGSRLSLNEKENYDCVFLKDNKCSIYEVRPKQCRQFPWWAENVKNEESWKRTKEQCEGINEDAPLFTEQEILKLFV